MKLEGKRETSKKYELKEKRDSQAPGVTNGNQHQHFTSVMPSDFLRHVMTGRTKGSKCCFFCSLLSVSRHLILYKYFICILIFISFYSYNLSLLLTITYDSTLVFDN